MTLLPPIPTSDAAQRWLPGPGEPTAIKKRRYGKTGHGYTVAGSKVLGVTTALNDGIPKPQLIPWAAGVVAEYVAQHREQVAGTSDAQLVRILAGVPNDERDEAAHKGTSVHTLAHRLLEGAEVDVPEELRGHVDSYQLFHRQWQPVDVAVEVTVANLTIGYAGTLDYLCELPGMPGLTLIDIKTGRSGIFGETALQLAAYSRAEVIVIGDREWPMPEVDRAFGLWVRSDGYDLVHVDIGDAPFDHFRAALAVARRKDALRSYVGDMVPPPAPSTRPHLEVL